MSTTSRPSKLDIRLRNPTSTQRQWLQDTDLLAVRILYALRTPRRDFEGGGGSGTGAMAGRTRRHQPGIHDHGAMATAVFVYTEACELEGVVRGIFGAACPLLVQLTHRDRRRPQLDLQRMDSTRSKRSARNIEILPCGPHLHA